ncbi:ABC transporter permease [Dactylosporangium sp. NPDC048998]|uniref:ABC transporter permease n=1 Tax=Dactylosporangium sp. NPDC048998 TaxID=3363976 RepID=UPI003716A31F
MTTLIESIVRRPNLRPLALRVLAVFTAVGLAALVGALVLIAVGKDPLDAYQGLYDGAFGTSAETKATLAQTTPLILAALSFVVAFRSGIFNAGGQGQVVIGAFAAAAVGSSSLGELPRPFAVALVVLAGAAGGALWSLPPVLFKVWWRTNEILTSLMLTYVAILLNDYLVQGPFRATSVQPGANAQTESLRDGARFPLVLPDSQVTFLLPVGLALAVLVWWAFRRTTLGYELRLHGSSPLAARSAGIGTTRVMILGMLFSGALAGMAGAAVVGGVFHAGITPFPPDIGFNGILAALLVGASPLLTPLAALFFGALAQGGLGLQIFNGVSQYIAMVLTATVILFIAPRSLPESWMKVRLRMKAIVGRGARNE